MDNHRARWQRLQLMLSVLALLAGCRSGTVRQGVPSVWSPATIQSPEDARREVVRSMQQMPDLTPQVADPRMWNRDDPAEGRSLGLSEALAIAMTNSPIVRTLSQNEMLAGATRSTANRVHTIYDPAIEANRVEAELGRFDAVVDVEAVTEPRDDPAGIKQDRATIRGGLRKPTIYGGEATVGLGADYRYLPLGAAPQLNPQYEPELGLGFRQPLSRGAGPRVNLAPIVIVAAEAEQSKWELHDALLAMTRSIESTYWAMYEAQATARAIEDVLPLLHEVVRLADANVRADMAIPADLAQAKSDLLDFERQYVEALLIVRNREALLQELLGLPPDPFQKINPDAPPVPSQLQLDWEETLDVAMRNRPDIMRNRLEVYITERAAELAQNQVLPQIDAFGGMTARELGDDLGAAIDLLGDMRYVDMTLGLAYRFPVGNHTATAELRSARLLVERERAQLREAVHAAVHQLSRLVFEVDALARQHDVTVQKRAEIRTWLRGARARYMNPTKDMSLVRSLDLYLRAIREAAEVDQEISRLTAEYYASLARLEEAKGTLLASHNIVLQDDPRAGVQRLVDFAPEDELDSVSQPHGTADSQEAEDPSVSENSGAVDEPPHTPSAPKHLLPLPLERLPPIVPDDSAPIVDRLHAP